MPKPYQRTRSTKRRLIRLPSGNPTTHYTKKRTKTSHCLKCGRYIFGIPSRSASKLNTIPLSKKRPQRIFGGQLCSTCLKESLKHAARSALPA